MNENEQLALAFEFPRIKYKTEKYDKYLKTLTLNGRVTDFYYNREIELFTCVSEERGVAVHSPDRTDILQCRENRCELCECVRMLKNGEV